MFWKTLKRAGLGFLLGTNVGSLIAFITSSAGGPIVSPLLIAAAGSESTAMFVQSLLSGVLGAAAFAGVSLYEIEEWGMLKIAVVHFAIIEAVTVPIELSLGWAESAKDVLIIAGMQAAAYFVIWLIMNEKYKAEVRKLNALLEQNDKGTVPE